MKVVGQQRECLFAMRGRAYELAETGRYKEWRQVAYALLAEGFLPSVIQRFDRDGLGVMMVTRCCRVAIAAIPSSPSRVRGWFGRLSSRLL